MRINSNKVIEDRLAASFGLEQYGYIISQWKTVDVSADEDFQTKFNGYYRVRRNAEWRECYYALFQRGKSEKLSFADIITYLYENTGNVESSFSSKLILHTGEDISFACPLNMMKLFIHISSNSRSHIRLDEGFTCVSPFNCKFKQLPLRIAQSHL